MPDVISLSLIVPQPFPPIMPISKKKKGAKKAHKKRREQLKKQARAPGTQKGFLCCSVRFACVSEKVLSKM